MSGASPTQRVQHFERLYTSHHAEVFGYVMRRCDSPDDAADAIADTFLVAWRRLDDAPTEAMRPWLYGIARRVLANQRRGQRRRTALSDRIALELAAARSTLDPPAIGGDGETADLVALRAAYAALPEPDRELLVLVAWEELRPAEIAAVLGCSVVAVRTRMHRARARLRRGLAAQQSLPAAFASPLDSVALSTLTTTTEQPSDV